MERSGFPETHTYKSFGTDLVHVEGYQIQIFCIVVQKNFAPNLQGFGNLEGFYREQTFLEEYN